MDILLNDVNILETWVGLCKSNYQKWGKYVSAELLIIYVENDLRENLIDVDFSNTNSVFIL